mmetsp:Transcript_947/g.1170  ORF Transcript_947/g.1170 Transcript_947/m.1170 type:complete len:84 (-) Transcript_947:51-302(-)
MIYISSKRYKYTELIGITVEMYNKKKKAKMRQTKKRGKVKYNVKRNVNQKCARGMETIMQAMMMMKVEHGGARMTTNPIHNGR